MLKRGLLAFVLCALPLQADAQPAPSPLAWPTPTRDSKPWTRWWWLGSAVDKNGLTSEIDGFARAGFGGVEVTVIYGAKGADSAYIPYLTPRWVEMIAHTANEVRRHGMGLDLPQGSGWRTGGPSVVPADANASLTIRRDSVAAGGTWQADLTGRRIERIAAVSEDGQTVLLATGSSRVQWQAPAGRWSVYTAETRFSGDNVKRPAPGGEGPSIDPFSASATAHYLAMFGGKMAPLPKGAIRSYFHDSFEYTGDASTGLFDVFKQRRGYDLATELPAMTGRGDPDHVARVKSDYRQTLDEMLLENFVGQLTTWSHDRGSLMREQAHGSPGNLLDLYARSDIPETEIFGPLGGPDGDPLVNKFASSAAHVAGKRLASAESFTWLGEHFSGTLSQIKQAADRMFLAGINHLIYHGTAYSPSNVEWPGWQFYASTEFNSRNAFWHDIPAFNQYITRVQSILQSGRPDNDVLLYWPIADNWHNAAGMRMDFRVHDPQWFHAKPFGKLAHALHESGFGVDYVSDRQLATDVSFLEGKLQAHASQYGALVIPTTTYLPPETFARLIELARSGATVIFVGELPGDVPGLSRLSERRAELAALSRELTWTSGAPRIRSAAVGRGRMLTGDDIAPLLTAAGVRKDAMLDAGDLEVVRRASARGRDYFVVATRAVSRWIPLDGRPAAVALMDPVSGRTGLGRLRSAGGRSELYVTMDSTQSLIVRVLNQPARAPSWSYADNAGAPVTLRGSWHVSFLEGGPVKPAAYAAASLSAWTDRGDADADRFAGTARYALTFDAPDAAHRHILALGEVLESARVRLNGRDIGTRFAAPYRLEVGQLRRTDNVLEIDVTNVSANRIRDLDRRGIQWKNFKDINFVGIDYKPFDASGWPVRRAGLIGPVTLQSLP